MGRPGLLGRILAHEHGQCAYGECCRSRDRRLADRGEYPPVRVDCHDQGGPRRRLRRSSRRLHRRRPVLVSRRSGPLDRPGPRRHGRPRAAQGHRGSCKQCEEGGVAPQVVFEVLSPSNTGPEMAAKKAFYERHGVREYYEYDPERLKLRGWIREGDRLAPIASMNDWASPLLGSASSPAPTASACSAPTAGRSRPIGLSPAIGRPSPGWPKPNDNAPNGPNAASGRNARRPRPLPNACGPWGSTPIPRPEPRPPTARILVVWPRPP
ncbi:MAG: Uma2 family endonuclease, partial [Isosphaeraceae bacterium]